ncbi:hypothetical protein ACHAPU_000981 [Fusarium lateritium]
MPGLVAPTHPLQVSWGIQPTLADIQATLQHRIPGHAIRVEFFSEGAYNKLYQVHIGTYKPQLLRLSLPVDPMHKTSSEAATLRAVASITSAFQTIPVPSVTTFSFETNLPIRYEWILMTKLDGITWHNAWPRLSIVEKSRGVRQVAFFVNALFRTRFHQIGNLYPASTYPLESPTVVPGVVGPARIVSVPFFKGTRMAYPDCGPFPDSATWIRARLDLQLQDAIDIISKYCIQNGQGPVTKVEQANATRTLDLIKHLQLLIDPITFGTSEQTVLHHDDLHANNILAHPMGKIQGIVDWECVSAVPLWKACSFPKFLYDPPRHEGILLDANALKAADRQLRDVFVCEMEIVCPEWVNIHRQTQTIRDLDFAVDSCHNAARQPLISQWIRDYRLGGEVPSLFNSAYDL